MAIVTTNVPINSQGVCPNPDAITSEVNLLDLLVYQLVPASPGDNISAWQFSAFITQKQTGALLPLQLGLPLGSYLSVLVLSAFPLGDHFVNLYVWNAQTGVSKLIDPKIIRK